MPELQIGDRASSADSRGATARDEENATGKSQIAPPGFRRGRDAGVEPHRNALIRAPRLAIAETRVWRLRA